MKWLVTSDVADELRYGVRRLNYSAADRDAFATRIAARGGPTESGVMTMSGDVAQIDVSGLLTKQPSLIAWLLGYENTSYAAIQQALALADSNPNVSRVTLAIDSPGGSVGGLFETLGALDSFSKPLTAIASMACSAAYAIASSASKIRAVTPASEFGSIGVATEIFIDPETVQIASSNAPAKRPDVRTEDGRSVVRGELDALHDLFVEHIARGRKTTPAKVNSDFGRGGTIIAAEARRRKMIDAIATPAGKKAVASASPYADLGLYLAQRMGGPMFGENELDFAERTVALMEQVRQIQARGGSVPDIVALFDRDDEDDEIAAHMPKRDLGDEVADLLDAQRGLRPHRLGTSSAPRRPEGPKDLGDQVVELMQQQRGLGRVEGTAQ